MRMADIILYASIASRSLTAFWMLEELGVSYEWRETDIRTGQHKQPDYLKINPQGRVPALVLDGVVITERPAICATLADRFSYGVLSPKLDAPERGAYNKWLVYAGSVLDPAICMNMAGLDVAPKLTTWNPLPDVVAELDTALTGKQWLLGDQFTAADVALGSVVAIALFNKRMPSTAAIEAYKDRLQARPAMERATAKTFPPHLFQQTPPT